MEISFTKTNNKWVSEFQVTSDFNIHLERNEGGTITIEQRTSDGQYDIVKSAKFPLNDKVIDCDFQALVYPKYIKIISDVNPTLAVVTFNE